MNSMSSLWKFIGSQTTCLMKQGLDLIYPPSCPLCFREEAENNNQSNSPALCSICSNRLSRDQRQQCSRCGAPMGPHLGEQQGCTHCKKDNFRFRSVSALGLYDDLLKTAILQAKQPGTEALATAMADVLWKEKKDQLASLKSDLVVPVPQHWSDRLNRDHHCSSTFASRLAFRLQIEYSSHVITKTRRTAKQSQLTPSQRRKNLLQAFKIRKGTGIENSRILLVDDVLTTGSTANEASKMLRQSGAREVNVAVLARGIGHPALMKSAIP